MSINTVTLTAYLKVQRIIESIKVSPKFSVVRITTSSTLEENHEAWAETIAPSQVREGFALTAKVKAFGAGKLAVLPFESNLTWVPQVYLDDLRLHGYAVAEEMHAATLATAHNQVFATATQASAPYILVRADFAGHMIFDLDDVPHPTGLTYNYMAGRIRDGYLDLNRVLAHLKQHPQVGIRAIITKYEKSIPTELAISAVPYYNVREGCERQIEFIYQPTASQMKAIWTQALKSKQQYPSTGLRDAIKKLDLLGLAQFKVEPCNFD